ncbi:MAG: alpha/beta hydrolase [Acidimicrobiia bacterium]
MSVVGDPGIVMQRARMLGDAAGLMLAARSLLPAASAMAWKGPGAQSYDRLHQEVVDSITRAGADIVLLVAALDDLAAVMTDVAVTHDKWEDRIAEAQAAYDRVVAAHDPEDGIWPVGAALFHLEGTRQDAARAVDAALGRLETADRAVQQAASGAVWFEPVVMGEPIAVLAAPLMADSRSDDWVRSLPRRHLDHLVATRPDLLGGHRAVDLADRYRANLATMAVFADGELDARIGRLERIQLLMSAAGGAAPIAPHLDDLRRYRRDLLGRVGSDRTFLVFEPAGDGRVVEVLGDLLAAGHVAVVVPGITNTQFDYETGLGADARRLWAGEPDLAVIAWLGYDTPGSGPLGAWPVTGEALGVDRAVEGAAELRLFVDWLMGLRPDAHISVIGHSYGSVVSAIAAADGLAVDDLLLVGSPGVPLHDSDSAVLRPGGRVWASLADGDPIADLAGAVVFSNYPVDAAGHDHALLHGVNPVHADFGAHAIEPFDGRGHSAYLGAAGVVALRSVIMSDRAERRHRRRAG